MRLYDGETVEGFKEKDIEELRQEAPDEGMSGVDPRYVINRISSALIRRDTPCINALDVLRALKDGLDQHPSITKEDRERLLNFIAVARKEYDDMAKKKCKRLSFIRMKNRPEPCSKITWTMLRPIAIGKN